MSRAAVCLIGMLSFVVGALTPTAVDAGVARQARFARTVLPAPCSKRSPASIARNGWSPPHVVLAPAGASAVRLCRYSGLNAHPPLTLARAALHTSPSLVRRLVREFDRLPALGPGVLVCPFDDGSEIVALLSYPDRHAVAISVGLLGCATVSNGNLHRTASGIGSPRRLGTQLLVELEHLTGYRGPVF